MKNKNNIFILALGIILSVVSIFFDKDVFYFFNNEKSWFFNSIFSFITSFINVFVVLILATTLFLLNKKKRKFIFPLWISFFLSVSAAFIVKIIIQRPRPLGNFYNLFNMVSYSFPSMHAMIAFSILPIINKEFPKFRPLWFSLAFIFAFSRIYLNYHFLSDVVFGAFLGYFIGIFTIYINEKYNRLKFLK